MAGAQTAASHTLLLLEERLQRLLFLVEGDDTDDSEQQPTSTSTSSARARLAALDRSLRSLATRSPAIADLLQIHRTQPDLFHTASTYETPSILPAAALAQLVLAHEQLYRTTNAQLTAVNDSKNIPDSSALTKLIGLQMRIESAEAKQMQQAQVVAELRGRSAKIVEKWFKNGVLEMEEKWADWEEQLRDAEILVRRREAAKRREEGGV
ncbi:hypothetical protein DOTSEDRAFT_87742 [Dothistroma septosporum NZE10]|uniref:Nuclear distribution protein RO10 n=1 Tax=Dothistroma septosporum (strain NZE10 / CBS 128990) TaxID=675120 RepID=N1PSH7_DOTSN|nr:hypothetical protein DOTSEDRAFT_87742 [Dothistroma septosporum NZE10]